MIFLTKSMSVALYSCSGSELSTPMNDVNRDWSIVKIELSFDAGSLSTVTVLSAFSGVVAELNAHAGDRVEAGQALATLSGRNTFATQDGTVSLINALVVSLCVRRHAELSETLGAQEQAWTGYRMEEIDEMTSRDLAVP